MCIVSLKDNTLTPDKMVDFFYQRSNDPSFKDGSERFSLRDYSSKIWDAMIDLDNLDDIVMEAAGYYNTVAMKHHMDLFEIKKGDTQ